MWCSGPDRAAAAHDATWRPFENLPALRGSAPAAAITRFLLDTALDRRSGLFQAVD